MFRRKNKNKIQKTVKVEYVENCKGCNPEELKQKIDEKNKEELEIAKQKDERFDIEYMSAINETRNWTEFFYIFVNIFPKNQACFYSPVQLKCKKVTKNTKYVIDLENRIKPSIGDQYYRYIEDATVPFSINSLILGPDYLCTNTKVVDSCPCNTDHGNNPSKVIRYTIHHKNYNPFSNLNQDLKKISKFMEEIDDKIEILNYAISKYDTLDDYEEYKILNNLPSLK